jgi:3',5'-cyclic AMP phosphodiesterase CpdA
VDILGSHRFVQNIGAPVLKVNVISDIHYDPSNSHDTWMPGGPYNSQRRVEWLLEKVQAHPADVLLLPGDLVDRQQVKGYSDFDRRLQSADIQGKIFVTPGNHDDRQALKNHVRSDMPDDTCVDEAKTHYSCTHGEHVLFVLDSAPAGEQLTQDQKRKAFIGDAGLEWLSGRLQALLEGCTAWIFTHYPANNFGVDWISGREIIEDGVQLHGLLKQHLDKVGGVFSGHLHHRFAKNLEGVAYHSLMPASRPLTVVPSGQGVEVIRDPHGTPGFEILKLGDRGKYMLSTVECGDND